MTLNKDALRERLNETVEEALTDAQECFLDEDQTTDAVVRAVMEIIDDELAATDSLDRLISLEEEPGEA